MLVLGVMWWAWVGYAWLTSVVDPEEGGVRIVMFGAIASLLVATLCVPRRSVTAPFRSRSRTGSCGSARSHCSSIAARDDPALRRSVVGLAVSTAVGGRVCSSAPSFADGGVAVALWIAAIVVDFGGPAVFGIDGWKLVPAHFAERHGLIIILALGESIVALGVGAEVDAERRVVRRRGARRGLAAALWWIYFDVVSLITASGSCAPSPASRATELARDSYSYLHFPMVAGIVLTAYGLEEALPHLDDHLHVVPAFALLGGVAVYLLGHVALAAAQRALGEPHAARRRVAAVALAARHGGVGARLAARRQRGALADDRVGERALRRRPVPPPPRARVRLA